MSLTEVLIAMGIMTLGLLGVASVFPVGSYYMQKAEVSDKGSAIAQSVMSDIMARGMLNPSSWYVMVPNPISTNISGVWNYTLPADNLNSKASAQQGTFTRPVGLALNQALDQAAVKTDRTLLNRQFGNAFVIDPLGVAAMSFKNGQVPTQVWSHGPAAVFPSSAYNGFGYYANSTAWGWSWVTSTWAPWSGGSSSKYNGFEWPIRRVTFREPATTWQMSPELAEHFFRGDDDLTVDFPARDDRPGIQSYDTSGSTSNPTVLARKWTGDYSWIVTVAPTTNAARDAIGSNPQGFAYDVSVVVFYKRILPENADSAWTTLSNNNAGYLGAMSVNERVVKTNVISSGLNGGELLLTDMKDVKDTNGNLVSAFTNLKTGHWIMLCGPHPNSSASEPRLVLNWYQVISIEEPNSTMIGYDNTNTFPQKVVTLRGSEWPWQPSNVPTNASNDLCVGIFKGAVAVHTRSMRLESSASGSVGFGSPGDNATQKGWPVY